MAGLYFAILNFPIFIHAFGHRLSPFFLRPLSGFKPARLSRSNCETACLLSKLNAKRHIEADIRMDEHDLADAEKKAACSEIKEYAPEHAGLKVSGMHIAQAKRKCGIVERENRNKPKSEDAKRPECPPDKEKAIKEALFAFRHGLKQVKTKRLLFCGLNMDTACAGLKFNDGGIIAIDAIAAKNKVADAMHQRSELDWLNCDKPLEYAQLVSEGDLDGYLKRDART